MTVLQIEHFVMFVTCLLVGGISLVSGTTVTVETSTCGYSVNIDKVESVALRYIGGQVTRCKFEFQSTSNDTQTCWSVAGQPECTTTVDIQNKTGDPWMTLSCDNQTDLSPLCTSEDIVSVIFSGSADSSEHEILVTVYSHNEAVSQGGAPQQASISAVLTAVISVLVLVSIAMVIVVVVCFVRDRRKPAARPKGALRRGRQRHTIGSDSPDTELTYIQEPPTSSRDTSSATNTLQISDLSFIS